MLKTAAIAAIVVASTSVFAANQSRVVDPTTQVHVVVTEKSAIIFVHQDIFMDACDDYLQPCQIEGAPEGVGVNMMTNDQWKCPGDSIEFRMNFGSHGVTVPTFCLDDNVEFTFAADGLHFQIEDGIAEWIREKALIWLMFSERDFSKVNDAMRGLDPTKASGSAGQVAIIGGNWDRTDADLRMGWK